MRFFNCSWLLIPLLAVPVSGQAPQGVSSTHSYIIFVRGTPVGREEVSVTVDASGTTIRSEGQSAVPADTRLQHVELRYNGKGSAESIVIDSLVSGSPSAVRMSFSDGTATTRTVIDGKIDSKTQRISPDALVLPRGIFASFAALAQRLSTAIDGAEFHLFFVPSGEVSARLFAARDEQMQTGPSTFKVRRYDLAVPDVAGETILSLTTAEDGSLLRIAIPAQSLDILREDIAAVNTRTSVHSNPGDQQAQIPALGFNLSATLTVPSAVESSEGDPAARWPAVVLVAGRDAPDRDSIAPGAPVMSQLAGALAESGMAVVRYDQRGLGQSGGRTESATFTDYAEDARAVVKWLAARKDVDPKRIAIVGHGQGAWIALLTASREKRVSAVVTLGAAASTGGELVLEQQKQELDAMALPEQERAARESLQKQIHEAVVTGKGWDQLPADVRRRADTPWFQSVLTYKPAEVMDDVDSPVLIVHGEVDREVPVAHATRLAALAPKKKSAVVTVITVPGVNHQLMPALTGNVREYPALSDRGLSRDVSSALTAWLMKTLPAPARRR